MPESIPDQRLMVLMFTDLVGSSGLKVQLGDLDYATHIATPHNAIFRDLIKATPGAAEIVYTGDGFFASFNTVGDAVNVALLFHLLLKQHAWDAGVLGLGQPRTRVGIHVGQVVNIPGVAPGTVAQSSHAADMCARVMSLAVGGQTLLTRHAFDDGRQYVRHHPALPDGGEPPAIQWQAHGRYIIKGKDEDPLEIFEVGAVGVAPLTAPPDSEKVKRAVRADELELLGWRPAVDLEVPGKHGWKLERKLGEGGFGEVWLVHHAKTRRQRVFKFCFDADRVRSFKRELTLFRLIRDVLGERDDIAGLHDVRLDQPPYFLESDFIEAGDLAAWSAKRGGIGTLPLPQRLDFLSRVARAVAAAHSVGIIHKDLKPANILVRELPDGTIRPLLADFGIGAIVDKSMLSRHDITIAGFTETLMESAQSSRTGTRLYAPPEAQVGKVATTASDIYALGVLLYQVVVADFQRPLGIGWERDVHDELLRDDIRAAVTANTDERLGSASEFAARLEQLPQRRAALEAQQRARQEKEDADRRAAAQKRRMRIMRIGLVLAGVFLISVTMLGLMAFNEWKKSQAEQARAQRLFDEGHALANTVFFDLHDAIEQLYGSTAARELLAKEGLEYLNKVTADAGSDPALLRSISLGYERLGDVQLSLGKTKEALASQDENLSIRQRLAIDESNEAARDLAVAHSKRGNVHLAMGKLTAALADYDKCLAINGKLLQLAPDNPQYQRDMLVALNKAGDVLSQMSRAADALARYEKSMAMTQARAKAEPNDKDAQRDLAIGYGKVGNALLAAGKREAGLASYENALAINRQLAESDSSNARAQRDLSVIYHKLADLRLELGRVDEALDACEKCVAILKRIAEADRASAQAQLELSVAYSKLGQIQLRRKKPVDALASLRQSVEIDQRLVNADPGSASAKRNLSVDLNTVGDIVVALGQVADALPYYEKSLALAKELSAAAPDSAMAARDLSVSHANVGNAQFTLGRADDAKANYERALAIRRQLANDDAGNAQAQRDLWYAHYLLGAALVTIAEEPNRPADVRLDHWTRAKASFEQGLVLVLAMKNAGTLAPGDASFVSSFEKAAADCDHAIAAMKKPK